MSDQQLHMLPRPQLWKIRGKNSWDLLKSAHVFSRHGLWIRYYRDENAPDSPIKLGITVSRKYGNAIARNTFKRRIKSALRLQLSQKNTLNGYVMLIGISRNAQQPITYSTIEKVLQEFSEDRDNAEK